MSVISAMNEPVEQRASTLHTLLERGAIYRVITARAALITGILSTLLAVAIYLNDETKITFARAIRPRTFAMLWLGALIISLFAGLSFFALEARRSSRAFVSSEFRLTRNQIAPFLLLPAAFTGWFFTTGYLGAQELDLVVVWIAFYGLTLLSTSLFAPRAIVLLGWAFLLTSLAVPVLINLIEGYVSFDVPNVLMGMSFGLYHLIYAAFNWSRK